MKAFTYYHDLNDPGFPKEIILRWESSWKARGFETVILSEEDAKRHPRYEEISKIVDGFPTVNAPFFERACWIRWLAYATQDEGIFTDWDVINYDMWPSDVIIGELVAMDRNVCGTVYATKAGIESFVNIIPTAMRHIRSVKGKQHVSDMNLFRDWFAGPKIPFGCLAGDDDELSCKMVHFTNGLLKEDHKFGNRWKAMDELTELRSSCKSQLAVVIAHGSVEPVVKRHLWIWRRHGFRLWISDPIDDPLSGKYGDRMLHVGQSTKNHPLSCIRLASILDEFMQSGIAQLALFEYDSICLSKEIYIPNGFSGIMHVNTEPLKFMAPRFCQAPYLMDRRTVEKMLRVHRQYPNIIEGGALDRWLSALAYVAGVPIFGTHGVGYNTIEPDNMIDLSAYIIRNGVNYIHGIKHEWAFKFVIACHAVRRAYVRDGFS